MIPNNTDIGKLVRDEQTLPDDEIIVEIGLPESEKRRNRREKQLEQYLEQAKRGFTLGLAGLVGYAALALANPDYSHAAGKIEPVAYVQFEGNDHMTPGYKVDEYFATLPALEGYSGSLDVRIDSINEAIKRTGSKYFAILPYNEETGLYDSTQATNFPNGFLEKILAGDNNKSEALRKHLENNGIYVSDILELAKSYGLTDGELTFSNGPNKGYVELSHNDRILMISVPDKNIGGHVLNIKKYGTINEKV